MVHYVSKATTTLVVALAKPTWCKPCCNSSLSSSCLPAPTAAATAAAAPLLQAAATAVKQLLQATMSQLLLLQLNQPAVAVQVIIALLLSCNKLKQLPALAMLLLLSMVVRPVLLLMCATEIPPTARPLLLLPQSSSWRIA